MATKWAKDKFGIDIKSLWSVTDTNSAFATKLRLAMSSGQEMPDIVTIGQPDNLVAQDLIDSGMYQEVGPLFDKYAQTHGKSNGTRSERMESIQPRWQKNGYSSPGLRVQQRLPALDSPRLA